MTDIGGFRDTYLGRQVVPMPKGPRAGVDQLWVWDNAASSLCGVLGEFGAFLALKSDIMATISVTFLRN